jgi:glycosyltransferase involved in cell wall biosynthesis
MRLSVLMPVYNELNTIAAAVKRVRNVGIDMEIICVDDCSSDGTQQVLDELLAGHEIDVLVKQGMNQGKAAAVRLALSRATGDVAVIQDADLEYDPHDLVKMIVPLEDGRADAVLGSRFRGETTRVLYYWHSVGNGLLTTTSNMLTNLNLTDMETCYKMIRTDLFKSLPLQAERFGIEPELTARLAQSGARVYEVPISYSGRTYAEGKKIGWKDGVAAFWYILRCNLFPPFAPKYNAPAATIAQRSPAAIAAASATPASGARALHQ